MQSIDFVMNSLLSKLDINQAKALRIARNNQQFEQAIRHTWSDNPPAADYLLAHINGIYFKKDEHPRKGRHKNHDYYVLGIYLDDSMAKSELNARREMLVLFLAQNGIQIDEILLHSATWGMRERHLFPHAIESLQETMNPTHSKNTSDNTPRATTTTTAHHVSAHRNLAACDQSRMLETLKRACCQTFEDYEQAWALLCQIEGAELTENKRYTQQRLNHVFYNCTLYVENPDTFLSVFQEYKSTIISKSNNLGLKLHDIHVRKSNPEISGMRTFMRQGAPVALSAYASRREDMTH